jgi:hypothetical protein
MPSKTLQPSVIPTKTLVPSSTSTLAATDTATITLTATPSAYGPTDFPANINPLTGLQVADPSILNRRPVMIKVANFPSSGRPHAGLSFADIVFDYGIDGGTDRYLALFYGQDSSKVGPIRSGRYVDIDLVSMYQGILGYGSAWYLELNKIISYLGARAIMEGDGTCPAICRDTTISKTPIVTNLMADTAAMTTYAAAHGVKQQRYNLDGMAFNYVAPASGKPGTFLTVSFGTNNLADWRYDNTTGKYLRWIEERGTDGLVVTDKSGNVNMIPLVDRITNQQLAFSNVIILYATYQKDFEAVYEIPVSTTYSYQKALIFRDGQEYEALWKSAGTDKPIQFFTLDKQPFQFKPGNSWINIGGTYSQFSQPDPTNNPGRWLYYFNPP